MPPSSRRRDNSDDALVTLDPVWVQKYAAKDVASAIDGMQQAVRSGRIDEARSKGRECPIPLSVTAAELQLDSRLSEGAESVVFAGHFNGMDVAAKKFKIQSSHDLCRFRKELVMLASFNHPNIIPVIGAKALPPDYTLILPLHRHNLHHRLHQQGWRPSWHELLSLSIQLASALSHIHSKEVVHRDIKPGNLLSSQPGSCQLADFGTAELQARLVGAANDTGGRLRLGHKPSGGFHKKLMAGTLEYMAPEVLLKEAQTTAADVYAAAVTINELATGVYPYADCNKDNPDCHTVLEMGYDRQELAAAVVGAGLRPLLPKACPPGYKDLMEACWQLSPQDRPSATELLAGLQHMEASLPSWLSQQPLSLKDACALKPCPLHHSVSASSMASWSLAAGTDCPCQPDEARLTNQGDALQSELQSEHDGSDRGSSERESERGGSERDSESMDRDDDVSRGAAEERAGLGAVGGEGLVRALGLGAEASHSGGAGGSGRGMGGNGAFFSGSSSSSRLADISMGVGMGMGGRLSSGRLADMGMGMGMGARVLSSGMMSSMGSGKFVVDRDDGSVSFQDGASYQDGASFQDDVSSIPDLDGLSYSTTADQEALVVDSFYAAFGERLSYQRPYGDERRPPMRAFSSSSLASDYSMASLPPASLPPGALSPLPSCTQLPYLAAGHAMHSMPAVCADVLADRLEGEGRGGQYQPHLLAGVFDTSGVREKMEDRSLVAVSFGGLDHVHLFGVFDGHRGRAAADFVAEQLPSTLAQLIAAGPIDSSSSSSSSRPGSSHSGSVSAAHLTEHQGGSPAASGSSSSLQEDADLQQGMEHEAAERVGPHPWSRQEDAASGSGCASGSEPGSDLCTLEDPSSSGLVPAALVQSFLSLDRKFAQQQEWEWHNRVARMGLYAAGRRPFPGCTALAAMLLGNVLYVANAGDCRAVLARGSQVIQLNREHNADCEDERRRVEQQGGDVVRARDGWRVGANQLQVTRSIGDLDEKAAGVIIATPEVTRLELSARDEFIIIGSDGLWDKIGNEEAVGLVRDTVKDPFMCGKRLATEAMVRGSRDNITVMVVFLREVSSLERVFADGVAKHGFTATEYSTRA